MKGEQQKQEEEEENEYKTRRVVGRRQRRRSRRRRSKRRRKATKTRVASEKADVRRDKKNINMTDAPIRPPLTKQTKNTKGDKKRRTGMYEEREKSGRERNATGGRGDRGGGRRGGQGRIEG